jgi:predicted nucleic-acid-binding protein
MILLDANVVLRYLLNDNAEQASAAKAVISTEQVTILLGVLAEIVYVLSGVYSVPREEVSEVLTGFGNLENVAFDEEQIAIHALGTYSVHNIDFIDSILYSYHVVSGSEIKSYDKKLMSLIKKHDSSLQ